MTFQASTFAHVQLHRGNIDVLRNTADKVCPKLRRVAFAAIEVMKHARLLMGCSNRPLASSCNTSTFAHGQLHRGQLIDVLRNMAEKVCSNLRMVAFALIEVVKHVRLLMSCSSNRPLASSHSTCALACS